jgi:potassium/sodium efflux P-type ATPase
MENNSIKWHNLDEAEAFKQLNSTAQGHSSDEAKNRFEKFGPNQIKRKSNDSIFTLIWRQINNPLIWVLLGSSTLATLLGKITDGLVVLSVVVVNTIIGFIQEFKASKAIEALSDMIPENAVVLRDGNYQTIPVSQIVPGDIVQLAAGDRVPADMRIIQQKNLLVEEAALTGESLPVQKTIDKVKADAVLGDRSCMVYSGTLVSNGTATAVVVSTGMATELGKISDMLNDTIDLETPLTKSLAVIGKYLTIGIVLITVVIMVIGTFRALGQGVELGNALKDSLIFAIALAVGAIPEGLPAVVTIALAIGVQRMAQRKAIIRKLPAVETLGSTTVICSDKTGTLTRNEMTVSELWTGINSVQVTGVGYNKDGAFVQNESPIDTMPVDIRDLLESALLCSDATIEPNGNNFGISGDPTEAALLVAAAKKDITATDLRNQYPRIDVIPFDSGQQYMATLHANKRLIMKGAPEVVLKRCQTFAENISPQTIVDQINNMGAKGMRVLAVAHKNWDKPHSSLTPDDANDGFEFAGLIAMIDPPRAEAVAAIRDCHQAGIVVKMITGDHKETARSIGIELGLDANGKVITGRELAEMSDNDLIEAASSVNIFARVAPEHKLKLVKALQSRDQIVAMTGDGVNDAPSLKQSNIGVAMGITGTSVSKESSDIVLADDNFASISAAVEEGRRVYDNLLKSLAFLLPTNLGLAFILIWGIMFFPFNPFTKELLLPMLPTQLLWINLIAAVALALPLAFEVKEPDIMRRPPRNPSAPLFNAFITFRVVFVSILMTVGTVAVFNFDYKNALEAGVEAAAAASKAQTMAVTFVIVFQIFYMLNCRSLRDSIFKIGWFSNQFVFVGIGSIVALQAMFIYLPIFQKIFNTTPLSLLDLAVTIGAGFLIFPVIGLVKLASKR